MSYVLAIDAGTTGVRCRAVYPDGRPSITSYREFAQHFPEPGWVEHDADEIWRAVVDTFVDVVAEAGLPRAIGITNQRETVVAWSRSTGRPLHRAIVWQDRRTASHCERLQIEGHLDEIRAITGLVLDPYFSGTKMRWLLDHLEPGAGVELALGTIDSWILNRLTDGEVFATDPSNASRTMLFDINRLEWSPRMGELLGVPVQLLPAVRPSSSRFGFTSAAGLPSGVPISGIAGDQQAALFGQACFNVGSTKNTYGTGSFILMNIGPHCPPPTPGLLTTVAWSLPRADGGVDTTYAFEGAVFVTGAAVQWLRDGLGLIQHASEIGPLAESVPDSGGVHVVPAFTGLGSPWWDPHARGTIVGITRGTTRAHIARAVVESMALQTRDAIDAMQRAGGITVTDLRVDGGASVMDLLLRVQADQLGIDILRPVDQETTSLGAAYLAGLAEGVWPDLEAIASSWRIDTVVEPNRDRTSADSLHSSWLRAVERSRDWD